MLPCTSIEHVSKAEIFWNSPHRNIIAKVVSLQIYIHHVLVIFLSLSSVKLRLLTMCHATLLFK